MSANRARKNGVNGGNAVHLSNLKIVNGCLVFDVCSGKFHRVSETAAFVISELKQQTPIAGIVSTHTPAIQNIPRHRSARYRIVSE